MDSNNMRKYIPGILIMTLIFLGLSIFSINNMFKNKDKNEVLASSSYMTLLEKELGTKLEGEDEFAIFESVGYDLVVIPKKYDRYFKPCFDFVVVRDGIVVKNQTAKEFLSYPLEIGSKIVKIDDKELKGLSYFEIIDLVYSSELSTTKKFVLSNGNEFDYKYEHYSTKEQVTNTETEITIKLFNLDSFTRKGIYEKASLFEKVTFDLSDATVTDVTAIKNFMSFFTKGNEELFSIPSGVKSLESYKLQNATILVGDNKDNGILFLVSALKSLNANVAISDFDFVVKEYKTFTVLENSDYEIRLYNYVLKTKSASSSGSGVLM